MCATALSFCSLILEQFWSNRVCIAFMTKGDVLREGISSLKDTFLPECCEFFPGS